MRIALVNPAIPPTLNTAIIASTPSISIIDRPVWEIVLSPRLKHPSSNLLTRLVPCCNKILGTGPRMTGARIACFVPPASFVLCLLSSHTSFFLQKLAKTSVAALKRSTIRHLGFAERERDLWIAYFSSFFPHFNVNYYT